jgi:DNA-binding beta-propeller fold protein YncE
MSSRKLRGAARRRIWIAASSVALIAVVAAVLAAALATPSASTPGRIELFATPTSCPVGYDPGVPAFNPVNHDLYVPNTGSGNVTVLTPSCHSLASISLPVMAGPSAIVYDPADNDLYVTDTYLGNVYVLHGLNLIHTFPSNKLDCPSAPAYDPILGDVVIGSHCGTPQLTLLNGTSIVRHIGSTKIWSGPVPAVYDPTSGRFLVSYTSGDNVTFYNASTFKVLGSIPVGTDPGAIAYDSHNHFDYVVNYDTRNVTVFSSVGAGRNHGSLNVGSGPVSIAYSPKTEEIYVANSESANVSVINGTTLKAPIALSSFATPDGLVYDATILKMYVADGQHAQIVRL